MSTLHQNRLIRVFKKFLGVDIQEKDYPTIYLNLLEANFKDLGIGKSKDNEKYTNEDYIYLTIFNAGTGMRAEIGNDLPNWLTEKESKPSIDMKERLNFTDGLNKDVKRTSRLIPNKTMYLTKIRHLKIYVLQEMIDTSIGRFIERLMKVKGLKKKILLTFDFTEEEYYGKSTDKNSSLLNRFEVMRKP
ncbi:MAG: hypothetical protein ACTSVY_04715 [Candidatus Helarchaeota archaeon]